MKKTDTKFPPEHPASAGAKKPKEEAPDEK